ncbi:Acetylcholine-activated cation-selective channel, partial [Blomia tropicalis]
AKRLYDDLINGYNSMIRPVGNNSDRLVVRMGLRLSQLIDVNLKNQIMTTNMWVEQQWTDYKLKWEPEEYGGVNKLHVPAEQIWLPDLVLYNNADGNYEITILTKAILHSDGLVIWKPPAIYKSSCEIDVEYFPFDEQTCFMKFGSWTYDGNTIDLRHIKEKNDEPVVEIGMDLSGFYLSVEWDVMAVPARRKLIFYSCCEEPYIDITFNITLRRKTLFYTFNLIIPCVLISFLSILVFYLPSDSGEKVIINMLFIYFIIILWFNVFSVATIAVLNLNFRSPATHQMSPFVRKVFIDILPKFLYMERPHNDDDEEERNYGEDLYSCNVENQLISKNDARCGSINSGNSNEYPPFATNDIDSKPFGDSGKDISNHFIRENDGANSDDNPESRLDENSLQINNELRRLTTRIQFLSQHKKNLDSYLQVEEDWKYVAMVLDRLFLWIFAIFCAGGAGLILLDRPYKSNQPIDVLLSKVNS